MGIAGIPHLRAVRTLERAGFRDEQHQTQSIVLRPRCCVSPAPGPTILSRLRRVLSFVSLLVLPLVLPAGVADNPEVQGQQRLFESWMRGQMISRSLPGVAIGVVYDREVVWAKGFGYADVASHAPMTPTTKFRMASHSKLFTSTAIMQLRDAGKLRLDDPVSKCLPWF